MRFTFFILLACFTQSAYAHLCDGEYTLASGDSRCSEEDLTMSVKLIQNDQGKSALVFNSEADDFHDQYLDTDTVLASDASMDDDELQYWGKITSRGGEFSTHTDTGGVSRKFTTKVRCNRHGMTVRTKFSSPILLFINHTETTNCRYRRVN